jgi:predicted TIM-barrel fold metal-dependent hydrolase
VREIGALLQKPNVYVDISSQDLIIPPHTEAIWLREWLELQPQKVLFGTDGYAYSDQMDWPEATWIASRDAREALGISLTGMLRDHEISRARANQIARMVLRGNAEALYHFQSPR